MHINRVTTTAKWFIRIGENCSKASKFTCLVATIVFIIFRYIMAIGCLQVRVKSWTVYKLNYGMCENNFFIYKAKSVQCGC